MAISQRTLTTGEVSGSGVFDELMRTVKGHVSTELSEGRITEAAYAQVYLGSLQSTMSAALQFTLSSDQANKQVELATEQINQLQKQNELLELQKEQLRIANDTASYNLATILPKQAALLDHQVTQAAAQTAVTIQQEKQLFAQTGLAENQTTLVSQQITTEVDKTTDPVAGLNRAAFDKTQAEIAILEQKKLTELKQTTGTSTDTGGLVGHEMALKKSQADSFLRDAEQKAAKLYSDIFAVMYSKNAEGLNNQDWGFGSDEAFSVQGQLLAGVGAKAPTATK